ncbi:MAG: N-acetyltransferase [Rhodopirellula sp.]|nr:N-acetyltransferase [Rhodopirellula sp.]
MNELSVEIRLERPGDEAAIREVTSLAFESSEFGHNGEAGLVERLRAESAVSISLVAECANRIVGHILFSPATIERSSWRCEGLGLAPLSVLPEFQRQGIGSRLVTAGLEAATDRSNEFVIVLGNPDYYSRFGFTPASDSNVGCEFEGIPDEAFLIQWLGQTEPRNERGLAKYHPVFSSLG